MATKGLKVEELRQQLSNRGLDTTGTKPILVKRLEEAIEEEEDNKKKKKQLKNGNNRKRLRADNDDDCDSKMKSVEEYKKMSVKELRELATSHGISNSGTKKELIERLCTAAADSLNDKSKDNLAVADETETEKLVTATKKGAAVLDQYLPDDIKAHYHVLQQDNEIYDATLNQTNVGDNNNKFYIIQVLENDNGSNFLVYTRWGRVGAKGGTKINGPYTDADAATSEFESKFYEKTKNHWSDRKDFVCKPKQYTWLEMDYSESGKDSSVQEQSNPISKSQPRETKLESRIAKFISLICNINMMRQQMMEIGYNANKLPLGKLSKTTILKGYDVLKRLSDVIGQSNQKLLEELSSEFYTIIPHDFGFKKMREFTIDTAQKLKRKIEMVEALAEIEVATKLLEENTQIQDPLYYQYEQLRCKLNPVEVGSQEFFMIENYLKNTHAKTHSSYTVDIVQIFRASRDGETERYQKFSNTSNRMLLWHGSRLTNWAGILSQGLRIAPPEAPSTGYMFGKGVYFADMFSKSANYCYAGSNARDGVLLLCEVALGDMNELLSSNYHADKLPSGKLSTKGVGATAPDFGKAHILEDGVIVPMGKPEKQPNHKGSLLYNEYIVYNVEQIRMRYVIQVEFNYGR